MGNTTEMRKEIKQIFIPFALGKGFVLDQRNAPTFLEFRRKTASGIQLFDIQWDKYGRPRFTVNFGTCPLEGLMMNGKKILPEEVVAGWLSEHGRLQPGKGTSTASWFRQDKPFIQRLLSRSKTYPASHVVSQLVGFFPELEAYWATGAVGVHLRLVRLDNGT